MEKPGNNVYNPNVRVGNWNEEICFEEDILKDFLEKQESGSLLIQRTQALMNTLLEKVELGKEGKRSSLASFLNHAQFLRMRTNYQRGAGR